MDYKMKEVFARLVSKGKNKKAAIIAIARKLLVLIYTLWKNDSVFIQDYHGTNSIHNNSVLCT